jgi:shikimate kinase
MGSGKTTIGRALAAELGYRFIDNDAGLEAEYDATAGELAEQVGVEQLHRLEAAQFLNALASFGDEDVVIAAAASVVEDPACRAALSEPAVIWLRADPAYLAERVREGHHRPKPSLGHHQPRLAQKDHRRELYAAVADVAVDVAGRSVPGIVVEICLQLAPSDE